MYVCILSVASIDDEMFKEENFFKLKFFFFFNYFSTSQHLDRHKTGFQISSLIVKFPNINFASPLLQI